MIQLSQFSKSYGTRTLFDDVNFTLGRGERVGLVGRNGYGKSTLFKTMIGEEAPDTGNVTTPKGYRVGYLSQYLIFNESTVLEEACQRHQCHRWRAKLADCT